MNDKHALIKITKIWIIDQLIKTRTWNSGIYSIVPSVVAKHYIYISPTDAFGAIHHLSYKMTNLTVLSIVTRLN